MWLVVTEYHYYCFQWGVLGSHLNAVSGSFLLCQKVYISWENTEMLLCTYCIGLTPKTVNGYGFGHDSGIAGVDSGSETFSLFCSSTFLLYVCVDQELKNENIRSPVRQMAPESSVFWFSFVWLLYRFSISRNFLHSVVVFSQQLSKYERLICKIVTNHVGHFAALKS